MQKKILAVALASLALVLAVNFGLASAHPFAEPTPPANPTPRINNGAPATTETDVEQEGDHQDGNMDETDMNDAGDKGETADAAGNTTTTGPGQQGEQDRDTEQDGEFEGDD